MEKDLLIRSLTLGETLPMNRFPTNQAYTTPREMLAKTHATTQRKGLTVRDCSEQEKRGFEQQREIPGEPMHQRLHTSASKHETCGQHREQKPVLLVRHTAQYDTV